jgi:hypothetical protein
MQHQLIELLTENILLATICMFSATVVAKHLNTKRKICWRNIQSKSRIAIPRMSEKKLKAVT